MSVFPALVVSLSVAFGAGLGPFSLPWNEPPAAIPPSVARFMHVLRSEEVRTALVAESARASRPAVAEPSRTEWRASELAGLDRDVFEMARGAATCAVRSGEVRNAPTLTVIDYSRPSTEKRLWVFDLNRRTLLYRELVAHGEGSGDNRANQFSNEPDTHASSLGLFVTGDSYVGKNGYSMRLTGLDEGFNDRALERAIVMHGAPYVSAEFARAHGRLGRSWGCPALRDGVAREVIDRVKGGGLLFVYYPDREWLESSRYLRCADR